MYAEIINALAEQNILNSEDIQQKRREIAEKHPALSSPEQAKILARFIRRAVDDEITAFDAQQKAEIQQQLYGEILQRKDFRIQSSDLFQAAIARAAKDHTLVTPLTHWVNAHPEISRKKVDIPALIIEFKENSPVESTETSTSPLTRPFWGKYAARITVIGVILVLSLVPLGTINKGKIHPLLLQLGIVKPKPIKGNMEIPDLSLAPAPNLPAAYLYQPIDQAQLRTYLETKNSLLSQEPYFSAIIQASQNYNLNPLLLFAITGQEQAFVPQNHAEAGIMANNPFNVFGSWKQFNTDITHSARIAAQTIVHLSQNRPPEAEPLAWLNREYAEDPNWNKGVSFFYQEMEQHLSLTKN